MPIRAEGGRRSFQVSMDVPGTPEQIWRAIAQPERISGWFVPTTGTREGDHVTSYSFEFGPGMESQAQVLEWEPPRRFLAKSQDLGPDAPEPHTEWSLQDGRVTVRQWIDTELEDWDYMLAAWEAGWPAFMRILGIYLRDAPDVEPRTVGAMAVSPLDSDEAWARLGQSDGGWRGKVEWTDPREAVLSLDSPAKGAAHLFTMGHKDGSLASVRLFAYGPGDLPSEQELGNWLSAAISSES